MMRLIRRKNSKNFSEGSTIELDFSEVQKILESHFANYKGIIVSHLEDRPGTKKGIFFGITLEEERRGRSREICFGPYNDNTENNFKLGKDLIKILKEKFAEQICTEIIGDEYELDIYFKLNSQLYSELTGAQKTQIRRERKIVVQPLDSKEKIKDQKPFKFDLIIERENTSEWGRVLQVEEIVVINDIPIESVLPIAKLLKNIIDLS